VADAGGSDKDDRSMRWDLGGGVRVTIIPSEQLSAATVGDLISMLTVYQQLLQKRERKC
jgi:hypothetical protein